MGNDDLGVEGNHPEISFGGKLVRNLLASGQYILVNNTRVAVGGPFTRVDPSNENNKSCLGLVIHPLQGSHQGEEPGGQVH